LGATKKSIDSYNLLEMQARLTRRLGAGRLHAVRSTLLNTEIFVCCALAVSVVKPVLSSLACATPIASMQIQDSVGIHIMHCRV